ncbi:hypothetical protein Kisp01_37400 [Kineosporia sp. NBRC 101677]|uniref:hypothetical protein n=1 Tax=Kineosporia sp. NBRC 101677 TaxID=3032197 RepID=UPI0024A523BD|nr:hypothetical protein [Kineosporia sp. NBRC 101677]GLY16725.1 hypothetical protein Kisp01_37400 [Kineosporia sp. NBRC 101677]
MESHVGERSLGGLTTKDLRALHAQGVINSEFQQKASDYLSGKDTGDSGSGRNRTDATNNAPVVRQNPGGTAQVDGYL